MLGPRHADACQNCIFMDSQYPPLLPPGEPTKTSVMFIGENPSWQPDQRVPFDDNTNSGKALRENYISPMVEAFGLMPTDFWITDLFKCRYPKDIYRHKRKFQKEILASAGLCATAWLVDEIRRTKPQVIITLGDKEVYQRFRRIFGLIGPSDFSQAAYRLFEINIEGHSCKLCPACHPDVSGFNALKPVPSRKWSTIHKCRYTTTLTALFT